MSKLDACKIPDIYFDARQGSYWVRFADNRFLNLDARNVKLHMMRNRFRIDPEDDYGLKDGDKVLTTAQIDRWVDYAGPLAGHPCGPISTQAGRRILITAESHPVPAKRGSCAALEDFFGQLLAAADAKQLIAFMLWLKVSRESLLERDFRPGQMVVLAGPSGCGKSLCQALITEFLGGRMAKPYRYMTGATQFNSDLAAAEHLVIADEQASVDIRSRRNFGAAVKDLTVNLEMSVHAKGREAITLPSYRRLTLSCNDEAENLMILPPLDDSILDKLMLFKCTIAKLGRDRLRTWKTLTGELPALAYQLDHMRVSPALADDRYGVKAYHNAELLELVTGISPENRLLQLIDEVLFSADESDTPEFWRGSAIELEKKLRSSSFNFAVEKLLHFSSACGVYLKRLAAQLPTRFESKKNTGKTVWIIKP
jgi:hypothetical protein